MTNDLKQRVTDGTLQSLVRETIDKGLIYWEPNTVRGHERKAELIARLEAALSVEAIGAIDPFHQQFASAETHDIAMLIGKRWTPVYAHPSPLSVQTGVAVKALEWEQPLGKGSTLNEARTAWGDYVIVEGEPDTLMRGPIGEYTPFASFAEAKAAAQADYERRVLSTLSSAPAPSVEELRGALERAKARLDAIYNPEDDGLYTLRSEIDALLQVRP